MRKYPKYFAQNESRRINGQTTHGLILSIQALSNSDGQFLVCTFEISR